MKRFKLFWTLAAIAFAGVVVFAACEKEKDYRDKWVGEYSCKKSVEVEKTSINEGEHKIDHIRIKYTLSGTALVEKYGDNKIRFYSHTIFNHDSDTNISKSFFSEPTGPEFDTICYIVDNNGNLSKPDYSGRYENKFGYIDGDTIVCGGNSWSGNAGGYFVTYYCKKR